MKLEYFSLRGYAQWRIQGGLGGSSPPYGLQPALEQGELEEEKVKGEKEEKEEECFSPSMAVTWIRHCLKWLDRLLSYKRAYPSPT